MQNMSLGVQDFLTSIGTEALKEKGQKIYNENKIRDELKEYVKREYCHFESADKSIEIDFAALKEYFFKNLLNDFRECLVGEKRSRDRKKQDIVIKLWGFTGADTESKQEYVRNLFEDAFNIISNFYETKLIREEGLFLANKIIDDIQNEFREGFEKLDRKISKQNVSVSDKASVPNVSRMIYREVDAIHDCVVKKFIKKNYQNKELKYKEYSELFKMFIQITDLRGEKICIDNLFEFIKEKVESNLDENFIKIMGPDGTGKSTFVSVLYRYLYESYEKGEISMYPFYINLHYYDKVGIDKVNEDQEYKEIVRMMLDDMEELIELSKTKDGGVLLIIDGNESYFRTTRRTSAALREVLKDFGEHKKIICIGEKTSVHIYRKRKETLYIDNSSTTYNFSFKPIYIEDRQSCEKFISKFFSVHDMKVDEARILDYVSRFDLREVDYNLLSVFKECCKNGNLKNVYSLSDLYRKYCYLYFNGNEEKIDYCGELAYKNFITCEKISQETISEKWREWELIHQHKTISNYFLASYYGKILVDYKKENIKKLECVFGNGINLFIKSIINENKNVQQRIFENCKKMYENGEYLAKSQSAYIMGRIRNESLYAEIKRYLDTKYSEVFDALKRDRWLDKEKLLLFRTISISLFNLGGRDNKAIFLLEKMITNYSLNEVNRAFFLQYYDDVEYDLEQINFQDTGEASMSFTFEVLLHQIKYQLEKTKSFWTIKEQNGFQLNLFTLCSLVQVRLDKQIQGRYLEETEKLINSVLNFSEIKLQEKFEAYLLMMKNDIEKNTYHARNIYNELYAAKDVIRAGWIDRIEKGTVDVDRYENIVEHMYYTWLLGMLYLPDIVLTDEPEYKFYNKNKILDCILIHDLAQTYLGDKRPEETTQQYLGKINSCMQQIFMHDTYTDVQSMERYRNVWKRFELGTQDINGKIAKELEIIQSIYQFYVYKQNGAIFEEQKEAEWRIEKKKIKTFIGRKILQEVVEKTFKDLGA